MAHRVLVDSASWATGADGVGLFYFYPVRACFEISFLKLISCLLSDFFVLISKNHGEVLQFDPRETDCKHLR